MTHLQARTIPTTYSRVIALELGLHERTLNSLLVGTLLKSRDLISDSRLLSAAEQIEIIRNGFRLSGDEGLGLRIGARLTPPTHGSLGFLANSSPDLLSAVQAFSNFLPTRMNFLHLNVCEDNALLDCKLDMYLNTETSVHRFMMETASLSLLSTIEFVLGVPFTSGSLQCGFEKPSYSDNYENYINCPISFGHTATRIIVPLSLCHHPNVSADHVNYDIALQMCQSLIKQLPENDSPTTHKVNTWLLSHPPTQFSEERVAASLFITKRTLARRLNRENTSYRELKEKVLVKLAIQYLEQSVLSVEAIAALLHYHDGSSFRRAFRRWFGKSPGAYRNEIRNVGG